MKRLALIFALFWWAQGAVCLLPGLARAQDPVAVGAECGGHSSHQHHDASEPGPASTPAPEHDAGCEQHCASLARALSPLAPVVPLGTTLWLPLEPPKTQPAPREVAARVVDSHHGPPPRDLVVTNASLLI